MGDLLSILQWWTVLFIIGIVFLPFTFTVFEKFFDSGYSFSKIIGIGFVSYISFVLGTLKVLPFHELSLILIVWFLAILNGFLVFKKNLLPKLIRNWKIFVFEEVLLLIGIAIWSYVRAYQPDINGLEKFMDFGFLNSILRTTYLPATDMWFPPLSINYYYFGHFTTALITKLSFLPSFITYNLMIATIFAFSFVLSFSIVANLISNVAKIRSAILGGVIAGLLVSLSGNLHIIYSFFNAYNVDDPPPFWQLTFLPESFPNAYWYPNATRFIEFTIHEFPLYSFVVSDLHGHVVDIIFVLLGIALTYILLTSNKINYLHILLISFFVSLMYMTNAWDGLIYLLLTCIVIAFKNLHLLKIENKSRSHSFLSKFRRLKNIEPFIFETLKFTVILCVLFVIFTLPFNFFFKPFASGIGFICAPEFLTNIGKLGPFLFETDHCQRTPWWQFVILYGFFYFFVISFFVFLFKTRKIQPQDLFISILILLSTLLIIIPEFIYVKDIYPAHYRANTMFKLVYQSFIMLSLVSAYVITRIVTKTKNIFFYIVSFILICAVLSYPYFAVNSYYGELKTYKGIDGTSYLKSHLPDDYLAINWINKNIKGQPVIVEAQGDSYTDYGRISANTGVPTILGWAVHEWLWRGTYDIPAPRIDDIIAIYESTDINLTRSLLNEYKVEYIYIGNLERQKYTALNENKLLGLGEVVFQTNSTKLIKLN